MINADFFRKACGTFDIKRCSELLGGIPVADAATIPFLLEKHVRESGCLIRPRIKNADEGRRVQFVEYCRAEIAKSGDGNLIERFEKHLKHANLLERGYHTILDTLKSSPTGKLSPAAQCWAAIGRAVREIVILEEQITKTQALQEGFIDPIGTKVKRDGAPDIDPDFVVTSATNILGSTILMLAHENGWIQNQKLIVPELIPVDEETLLQAGSTQYLGSVWAGLKQSDDRLRYFGGELELISIKAVDLANVTRDIEVLSFESDFAFNLLEKIAHERQTRALLGISMKLQMETNAADKISTATDDVSLPPQSYISHDEILTFLALEEIFCYPVASDQAIYNGLALKHWLRGYAMVKEKLAHRDGEPVLELRSFNTAELIALFSHFGLSDQQALAFLEASTYSTGRHDLFNTPFLRGQGDTWYFFAPAYIAANLTNILVSFLSTNGVQFQTKGKRFENKTIELLNKHGINAKGFHYSVGNQQFECDAVFVWEGNLFVIECKNYGLSGLDATSSFHFLQKMEEAAEQVERNCLHLNADPGIVKKYLGAEVAWSKTIPCVLNALPWSAGKLGETYFYDSSALTRFFDEGFVALVMPMMLGGLGIQRRHKLPLWSGEKPTANDLLRQMENPIQIRSLEDEWEINAPLALLSEQLGLVSPFLKRRQPDLRRTLKSHGLTDDEIDKLLGEFKEVSTTVKKLRTGLPKAQ